MNANVTYTSPSVTPHLPTPVTTWQALCANIRSGAPIDELLAQYHHLQPEHRDVALAFRTAYCKVRRLSVYDVTRGNGALSIAYLCEGASFEACSCLAALIARCNESGGVYQ